MLLIDTLHIHTAEDTSRSLPSRSRLMYEAQAIVPVSSFMSLVLGELLYLSRWAWTTVLQETEV